MNWQWRPRAVALTPQAVVAVGQARQRLCRRLRDMPEEELRQYLATGNRDAFILFGPAERLPWVADVAYAAPSEEAASLWLPTTLAPDAPLDLLARATCARCDGRTPLLLWPDPAWLIPLDRQLPLSAGLLAGLCEALG